MAEFHDGIKFVNLPTLVNLKLASGMSGAGRSRDLSDVEELIRTLSLQEELAVSLDPYVRPKFLELWQSLHAAPKRYFIIRSDRADAELEQMLAEGITVDPQRKVPQGNSYLVTTDRQIADKYGMEDEAEFYNDEAEPPSQEPS